jgi:hypothetical protein
MERQIDIKALSETELKALGYEQLRALQAIQGNLAAIEAELKSRERAAEKEALSAQLT